MVWFDCRQLEAAQSLTHTRGKFFVVVNRPFTQLRFCILAEILVQQGIEKHIRLKRTTQNSLFKFIRLPL